VLAERLKQAINGTRLLDRTGRADMGSDENAAAVVAIWSTVTGANTRVLDLMWRSIIGGGEQPIPMIRPRFWTPTGTIASNSRYLRTVTRHLGFSGCANSKPPSHIH
jgi:hypothetical protein